MDDQIVNSRKDLPGSESHHHKLSKEKVLSREGTLEPPSSKLKRLVKMANPQHALISNVSNSTKGSLLPSTIGVDGRIPKHLLTVDENFRRRCLELIHISASKAAHSKVAVNLSAAKMGVLAESMSAGNARSGFICDSTRFVYECPLAAGGGSVVMGPAGQWIVGTVMGSKSMINILKSPLFHQVGSKAGNADSRRITSDNDKGSICYDLAESAGTLMFSAPYTEKEIPVKESIINDSVGGHRRLLSTSSRDCLSSDQSSPSVFTTISQGMLQCTWKGGNPHFVFATDEHKEVYVANMWKVQSKEDKSLDYIYLFHAGKRGQNKHEIRDSESHLVGKMKVSNLVSLCSNNSKVMETEFVLYGGVTDTLTSSHNLKKSKGFSRKMTGVFCTSHLSKLSITPKMSEPLDSSRGPCLNAAANSQDAVDVPNLLDDNLPPNFELAAIVMKDHLPIDRKEEAGGWGLKFLKKVGARKNNNSAEVSVPLECCRNDGNCSTSMDVLIPAGLHGGPRTENGGPSSLTERWRSGGYCDCGGWDLGCPLTVLKSKSSKENLFPQSDTQGDCKPFDLNIQGCQHAAPTLRMVNVHEDSLSSSYKQHSGAQRVNSAAIATLDEGVMRNYNTGKAVTYCNKDFYIMITHSLGGWFVDAVCKVGENICKSTILDGEYVPHNWLYRH